jgi:hypothetical protein
VPAGARLLAKRTWRLRPGCTYEGREPTVSQVRMGGPLGWLLCPIRRGYGPWAALVSRACWVGVYCWPGGWRRYWWP